MGIAGKILIVDDEQDALDNCRRILSRGPYDCLTECNSSRALDPFFTTKPAGQGTGLGLFLSYGIVSDHRGRIEVRNDAVGAVFDVYLPAVGLGERVHEGVPWGLQERS